MIISIDAEKAFVNPATIYDKNSQQRRDGTQLNIIKAVYDRPTANILSGEKLKLFSLRSGAR